MLLQGCLPSQVSVIWLWAVGDSLGKGKPKHAWIKWECDACVNCILIWVSTGIKNFEMTNYNHMPHIQKQKAWRLFSYSAGFQVSDTVCRKPYNFKDIPKALWQSQAHRNEPRLLITNLAQVLKEDVFLKKMICTFQINLKGRVSR